jgi:hypothetical protein
VGDSLGMTTWVAIVSQLSVVSCQLSVVSCQSLIKQRTTDY